MEIPTSSEEDSSDTPGKTAYYDESSESDSDDYEGEYADGMPETQLRVNMNNRYRWRIIVKKV